MAEATDYERFDLSNGEVAVKFGRVLDEDGQPMDNIYFQTLELLQEYGYDISPLVGRLSEREYWEEYRDTIDRIIDEFGLEQDESRATMFEQDDE